MVSEKKPEFIVQYTENIVPLIYSKDAKISWKAAYTLSYIADKIPDTISHILPALQSLIEKDHSTIVRDYTIDTIANYAKISVETAEEAYELLKYALDIWGEKHARQVIRGFTHVLDNISDYKAEIKSLVQPYLTANKKIVSTEAKKIVKRME